MSDPTSRKPAAKRNTIKVTIPETTYRALKADADLKHGGDISAAVEEAVLDGIRRDQGTRS